VLFLYKTPIFITPLSSTKYIALKHQWEIALQLNKKRLNVLRYFFIGKQLNLIINYWQLLTSLPGENFLIFRKSSHQKVFRLCGVFFKQVSGKAYRNEKKKL